MTTSSTKAKEARRSDLEAAILRLRNQNERINISSVARAVGVTPALIHNTYPDVAEQIRAIQGKNSMTRRDELRDELATLREANQQLRSERAAALADARNLASINETLRFELARAQGTAAGAITTLLRKDSAPKEI